MSRLTVLALFLLASPLLAQDDQQLNLPDASSDRFTVTGRVWPASHGAADVCMWEDDKVAAVSFAVDDNTCGEHDWWISMGDKYGFKFTWFVIVWPYMYDYDGSAGTNQGYFGTASTFQRLFDLGHDVQGHGTGAINSLPDSAYEYDLVFTKRVLEDSIPGNRCLTYAYPSGVATRSDIAAEHFIGARGTVGSIDRPGRVRCMNTYDGGVSEANIASILDPSGSYYRGWINDLVHLIGTGDTEEDKEAQRDAKEKDLRLCYEHRDDLWVAPFRKVISYNQSFATHTLSVTGATPTEIRFTLTDSMADSMFTYPLTVKVRLDGDWDDMTVLQNGSAVDFSIVLHEGEKYALVKAVPDQGTVVMTKTDPVAAAVPVITPAEGSFRDSVRVTMTCVTSAAEIRYTTDGSTPDGSSTLYTAPFALTASATVKARAFKAGLTASAADSAVLTVVPDTDPPTIAVAGAVGITTEVVVSFGEGVLEASAGNAGNYTIAGATVSGAELQADGHTVILTTSALTTGGGYTVTVTGVSDSSGNLADDDASFTMLAAEPDSGLAGYWSFDDGNAVALDYSGNGNTGLIYGAAAAAGTSGTGLDFDGDGDYVNIGASDFGMAATNEFTLAFWFNATDGWVGTLADSRNYIRPYAVSLYYSSHNVRFSLRASSTTNFNNATALDTDTWYHVALTYTDGSQTAYINGTADGTAGLSGALATSTSVDDYIGVGFSGLMDELRIYNRALSAAEVAALAAREPVAEDTTVVATPVIQPGTGTYDDQVNVTLSCATAGASLHYTTDGSDPLTDDALYSDTLTFTSTTTLKVRGFLAGRDSSDVVEAVYTVVSDTTAPGIASVAAADDPVRVTVVFTEPVAAADAENAANYAVTGLSVSAAVLGSDDMTVTLTVDSMAADSTYGLTVSSVTDRALVPNTATNLQQDFIYTESGGTVLDGLVSYWSMNTVTDSTVRDETGDNDGTITGSAAWTADAHAGGALRFDGDDALNVGTSDFGADASDEITVSVWFKADALSGNLFVKEPYIRPVSLHFYGSALRAIVRTTGTNYVYGSTALSTGTWYHTVLTVVDSTATIYLNGAEEVQRTISGTLGTGAGYETYIGTGYTGVIDEVQVYDRALTPAEVQALYTDNPMPSVARPVIAPDGGAFTDSVEVTVTCADAGAALFYTTDGTEPDSVAGTPYTGPFTLGATADVKVIGYLDGYLASATASAAFTKTSGIAGPYVPTGFRPEGASAYFDMNGRPVDGAAAVRGIIIRVDENGLRKELRY